LADQPDRYELIIVKLIAPTPIAALIGLRSIDQTPRARVLTWLCGLGLIVGPFAAELLALIRLRRGMESVAALVTAVRGNRGRSAGPSRYSGEVSREHQCEISPWLCPGPRSPLSDTAK